MKAAMQTGKRKPKQSYKARKKIQLQRLAAKKKGNYHAAKVVKVQSALKSAK